MRDIERHNYIRITTADKGCELAATADGGPVVTYEELSAGVGGYVEALGLDCVDGVVMWLNEEGKLFGLAPNPAAHALVADAGLAPGDVIVGDVVLTGMNSDGDAVALSDEQVAALMALLATA